MLLQTFSIKSLIQYLKIKDNKRRKHYFKFKYNNKKKKPKKQKSSKKKRKKKGYIKKKLRKSKLKILIKFFITKIIQSAITS